MTSILSFANKILNNESSWINTMAIIQTEDGSYLRENSEDSPIIGPFSDLEWHNIDEFAFDIQRSVCSLFSSVRSDYTNNRSQLSSSSSSSEQNVCSQVFDVYGSTSHSVTQTEMPRDSMTPTDLPAGPALPARRSRDRRAPSQAIKSPQMVSNCRVPSTYRSIANT